MSIFVLPGSFKIRFPIYLWRLTPTHMAQQIWLLLIATKTLHTAPPNRKTTKVEGRFVDSLYHSQIKLSAFAPKKFKYLKTFDLIIKSLFRLLFFFYRLGYFALLRKPRKLSTSNASEDSPQKQETNSILRDYDYIFIFK